MSKARLVITAVVLEGRSQAEVARSYGVSPGWVSKLVARYRTEGEAAFEPRSRRPKTSPRALPDAVVALILDLRRDLTGAGHDAGPETIAWHLRHHHGIEVSRSTIARHLTRAGLIDPAPEKRPRSSYVRFAAEQPNECWQSDFTHYRLASSRGPGTDVEILTWLDDHSRLALSVTAHDRVTGPIVLASFRRCVADQGIPDSTLTDNGMVFTTRLAGGRGGGWGVVVGGAAAGVVATRSSTTRCRSSRWRMSSSELRWSSAKPMPRSSRSSAWRRSCGCAAEGRAAVHFAGGSKGRRLENFVASTRCAKDPLECLHLNGRSGHSRRSWATANSRRISRSGGLFCSKTHAHTH